MNYLITLFIFICLDFIGNYILCELDMAQAQNNVTTFLIADPNGGQPHLIKVMAGGKAPFQVANAVGGASTSVVKTFIKANTTDQVGGTTIQTNKFGNRPLLAVPTKSGISFQGIRNPMVVPASGIQLLKSADNMQYSQRIIQTNINNTPMVIRTQTGSLSAVTSVGNNISAPIQLPQMTINKPIQQSTLVAAPILSGQLKQGGVTSNRQMFTLKTQTISGQKPELILLQSQQQKQKPDVVLSQRAGVEQISKLEIQEPSFQHIPLQSRRISPPKSLINTSILDHSGSRKRHDFDFDYNVECKRRKTEKGGKGLRHFSMKVCEKVQAKRTTSYNEVADELVSEFTESQRSNSPSEGVNYDQKNIRRRVYDALNVLMAMNIISKEKKEIHWLGLPTNSLQECRKLELERKKRLQKIKFKTQQLQDLILQQIAFKNLVERNRKMEEEHGAPSPNSAIQLPFIIVNTNKKTVIDCSISNDKTEYLFNFDDTFEIHDDIEVLKRRGMALGLDKGLCSAADLEKAKSLVPKALESYVTELAQCPPDSRDSKMSPTDDQMGSNMEEVDTGCQGEFTFEKIPNLGRMNFDHPPESRSSSSFGDFEEAMDESDIEI